MPLPQLKGQERNLTPLWTDLLREQAGYLPGRSYVASRIQGHLLELRIGARVDVGDLDALFERQPGYLRHHGRQRRIDKVRPHLG